MAAKKMSARFAGACKKCSGHMPVGTMIMWAKGEGAWHAGKCPEAPMAAPPPPAFVMVPFEELFAPIPGLKEALKAAKAVEAAALEALLAAWGGCGTCHGSGSYLVHVHSGNAMLDDGIRTCDCAPEVRARGSLTDFEKANPALVSALWEAKGEAGDAARALAKAEAAVAAVGKGDEVEVFKGRKVPVGTKGFVAWTGIDPYSHELVRVGVKDAAGTMHFTAVTNVRLLAKKTVVPAAAPAAAAEEAVAA